MVHLYVASRALGEYSYAFKVLEKLSMAMFENLEARPQNSGQSSRLPRATSARHCSRRQLPAFCVITG